MVLVNRELFCHTFSTFTIHILFVCGQKYEFCKKLYENNKKLLMNNGMRKYIIAIDYHKEIKIPSTTSEERPTT